MYIFSHKKSQIILYHIIIFYDYLAITFLKEKKIGSSALKWLEHESISENIRMSLRTMRPTFTAG